MHKAGTIANVGLRASKAVVSAAKNLLSSVPKEILEVQAEKYPDGKEIIQKVEEFAKVKDEVKDLVPPEKVGSVAGLTEKIKTIQADMEDLAARKEKTTDALKPQIDEWLKEYQDEIDFYNNQIKKVVKSKDPSGISEEIDDVTGEKIGAKKYIVDGKEVSQEEFDSLQGKPIGTKEVVSAEVKPVETYEDKVKQILINQSKAEGYRYMGAASDLAKIPIEDIQSNINDAIKEYKWKDITTDDLPIKTVYRLKAEFEAKGYGDIPDGTKLESIKDKIDSLEPSEGRLLEDDIYKRRKEELDSLSYLPMTIKDDMTPADKKKVQDRREDIKKINAKYDAELAELEKVKPTEVEVTEKVKPTEVALTSPEKMNVSQNRYGIVKDGTEAGSIVTGNPKDGFVKIKGVVVNEDLRGKGIAGDAYIKLGNSLAKEGVTLESDSFDKMEPSATRVWEKLADKGLAVKGENSYQFKPTEKVKPTEVKAEEVKVEVVKPKVEIKAEPKTLSVENKEYTTKTGRQKVVLKNNDLKVIDIKTGKEASPATRRKALDEYVERYDFSKGKTAQENTKEAPEGLSSEEVDRFSIEQSENPLEIASAYVYEEPISKFSSSKDAMIAEFGVGKITQESFKRWKDENLITGGMALTYFNKKEGLPLDVLAKSMSDHYGKEIDPQDIAEFIVKYPSGSSAALRDIESPTGRMAAERFKELTGLDLYRGMAEKIVKAEYEKKKQIEKDLIKEDYETAKQLEDAYWAAYKETDGFTKESPVSEVKPTEAPEKGVEEAYKDLTINQKRQIINSKFDELLKELKIEKICPT
jgi:hypothetical protein